MDKDKALSIALELVEYAEKNPIYKDVSDEDLQKAILGGILAIVQGGNKVMVCTTLEIAREVIRRFRPKTESVEVPVDLV